MDNDNETILAVIVIVLFVLGIFRVVGDMQELYRQTELIGSAKKDATDFDLEAALNRLGFYRREES